MQVNSRRTSATQAVKEQREKEVSYTFKMELCIEEGMTNKGDWDLDQY